MVDREVIYCVSGLVHEIARNNLDDWFHIFRAFDPELARELIEAAIDNDPANKEYVEHLALNNIDELKEAFHLLNLDLSEAETEVYEHWIVSNWFARKLEAHGETVEHDFYGLTIWGRTCTGQAILLDSVICEIYDELTNS